ncbi:ATP-binding protein [Actinomadura rugatobispora]|uniref:ATP-binding protein n=1 Tax=Actinomadura rugatobispora TaxID=1994 RepID=A0ABW1AA09_9ACTN
MLRGRDAQRAELARLAEAARAGRSGVLVVRGEAGIGKTALLDEAARQAARRDSGGSDVPRVLRATGVEAEAALPFAGLQMLLRPVLPRLDALPGAQADALRGALGLAATGGGDRFLVGLAVLTLLSELAAERPVLCLVDDAHWLDPASADALVFAARRLGAEGVALVFAARDGFDAPGLPELELDGLGREAAAGLLADRSPGLAAPLRDRILKEAAGNPLALIELPAGLSEEERSGRASAPAALPVTGRVLASFGVQIDRLPEPSRLVLLVAAAEGGGELGTVLRAAGQLGAGAADLALAERAGLVQVTAVSVAFRHPLVRAAAYQGAPLATRLAAHRALAAVLDGDRRALHRAAASPVPDESVAAELERTAQRARDRGALASSPALYEEAARLSPGGGDRARRMTRAAQAAITVGRTEQAGALAERALAMTGDPLLHVGPTMVRATVEHERGTPGGSARLLAGSAEPIAGDDPGLALTLLVIAAGNAWSSAEEAALRRVAGLAADLMPRVPGAAPVAAALVALERLAAGDHAAALAPLRDLVGRSRAEPHESLIVRLFVINLALLLGDDAAAAELASGDAARSRGLGLAGALPLTLQMLAQAQAAAGLHRDARAVAAEALGFARDTGQSHREGRIAAVTARLAAIEGDAEGCRELAGRALARGDGHDEAAAAAGCALALLDLAQGRYQEALDRLAEIVQGPARHTAAVRFATGDLVEAAVRAGAPGRADGPFRRFAAWSEAAGPPWARGVTLRCRALLAPPREAGGLFEQAAAAHREDGGRPFERARTELLHGEWLRRARRRTDARTPLRFALAAFERLGAAPWTERARAELRASGETAPESTAAEERLAALTPQELQIVRLAAGGASNRDIAARLFLSRRTVEYHLYKAYPKLGITSRAELSRFTAPVPPLP